MLIDACTATLDMTPEDLRNVDQVSRQYDGGMK
jgi:hypothetical protein